MDTRPKKVMASSMTNNRNLIDKKLEYPRSFSQSGGSGAGNRKLLSSYFSMESMLLLICLTASLLFLPLILPPLPPPPLLLLLVPIGILGLLMILAFMPCNVRDVTYTTYV